MSPDAIGLGRGLLEVYIGGMVNPSHPLAALTDLPVNLKPGYDPVMSVVLPALAVAFAAFCIWLTVRIINRRECLAKRTLATAVGLPVLYIASFGPVCWMTSQAHPNTLWGETAYRPITLLFECGPPAVRDAFNWYAEVLASKDCEWRAVAWHDRHGNLEIGWLWIDNVP